MKSSLVLVILVFGTIVLAIWALVPREVILGPRWQVTVRYRNGQPVVGQLVLREWNHFIEGEWHFERLTTNAEGEVVFPVRVARYSRIAELRAFFRELRAGFHGSWRSYDDVRVDDQFENLDDFDRSTTKVSAFELKK